MNSLDPQLESLIASYVDGRLSPDEEGALQDRLQNDGNARARFVELLDLHAMLAGIPAVAGATMAAADLRNATVKPAGRAIVLPRRSVWWAAAAVALVAAGVWHSTRPQVQLVGGVGQQFAGNDTVPIGSDLVGKTLELSQGFIELLFRRSDATLVIEAPAQFRVEDAGTLRVDSGRVTAHVRDGNKGLRVLTPEADVFDLGTRFAVDVTRGRRSEVHVFEGKVEAGVARSGTRKLLQANEALRFDWESQPASCDLRDATFVQPEEMRPLATGLSVGQDGRARQAYEALARDPALLAATDFDHNGMGQSGESRFQVQGARRVQGRFPGTNALEFVDLDDHVRLNLEASCRQLTFMAWVRLNQVSGKANSLYQTDGWEIPGQVHWLTGREACMRFAICAISAEENRLRTISVDSARLLTDELCRWIHLAVSYDADAERVRFYVNGNLDSAPAISTSLSAVLGPAQIGNWNKVGASGSRRLSGRMDEFVALSRFFSPEEIRAYYNETCPYR